MQITTLKKDLYDKLKIVAYALTGRISVYENITLIAKDNVFTIFATDGTVAIFANVGVNIIEEGMVSVNGARFKETITTYPKGQINLLATENAVTVSAEGFENILYRTEDNIIPTLPDMDYVELKMAQVLKQLDWAGYISLADGIIVGINDMIRKTQMGMVDLPLHSNIVLPKEFAMLVARLDDAVCQVGITENLIVVKQNDYVVYSVFSIPQAIDYKSIVPTAETWVQITEEFSNAVANAGKYDNEVILSLNDGQVNIRANDGKVGAANITINTKGSGYGQVKVYANELLGGINRTGGKLTLSDTGVVTLHGENYIELIAPLKR